MGKSTDCSCRGYEFNSQHPHGVAHNHLQFQLQGDLIPLAFIGVGLEEEDKQTQELERGHMKTKERQVMGP